MRVAGLSSERISQLLQAPCVVRTQIGGEMGLPEPSEEDEALAATRYEYYVHADLCVCGDMHVYIYMYIYPHICMHIV